MPEKVIVSCFHYYYYNELSKENLYRRFSQLILSQDWIFDFEYIGNKPDSLLLTIIELMT